MNKGGFSFKRFLGISRAKSNFSRKMGIPLTKGGRLRKLGSRKGIMNAIFTILFD